MTAINFVLLTVRGAFIFLAALTLIDLLRQPSRTRLTIALLFSSMALAVAVLTGGIPREWILLNGIGSIAIVLQPYLLLRMVQLFRPVSIVVQWVAITGMVLSGIILLVTPSPRPAPFTLIAFAYFAFVESFSSLALIHGSFTARGVTRWRFTLAAIGSSLFGLVIFIATAIVVAPLPAFTDIITVVGLSVLLFSGVSYFLGFATPRWLHRTWQLSELYLFLREVAKQPVAKRAAVAMEQLTQTAIRTVGGLVALIILWDETQKKFTLRARSGNSSFNNDLASDIDDGTISRAWLEQRPLISHAPAAFGAVAARLASTIGAQTLLVVPIQTNEHLPGLLLVFQLRGPLFAADDLDLLNLLAEECAKALDYADVLDKQHTLIAQLKESEANLEKRVAERTAELEAANKELDAFAHTVAHEVKTPLTQIIGHAEMVEIEEAKTLDEAVVRSLREIRVGAHKISEIIDELLLLAGARDKDVMIAPVNMMPIVAKARRRVAQQIENLRGEIQIPETLPTATGYAPWLEEVWVNYFSNALKYGGSPPMIDIGGEVRPDGFVRFWVKDNGAGISSEDQARLFTAFVRLHQGMRRGYGLGLSIVRRIVERCGGQVGVESAGIAGEGSTFWFTLPAAIQE